MSDPRLLFTTRKYIFSLSICEVERQWPEHVLGGGSLPTHLPQSGSKAVLHQSRSGKGIKAIPGCFSDSIVFCILYTTYVGSVGYSVTSFHVLPSFATLPITNIKNGSLANDPSSSTKEAPLRGCHLCPDHPSAFISIQISSQFRSSTLDGGARVPSFGTLGRRNGNPPRPDTRLRRGQARY